MRTMSNKSIIKPMKSAGKKASAAIGLGVTSLLTVMAVLLLTSFALLSLLSANSDLLLSEKTAQSVKDYYAADCHAETWWAALNQTVKSVDGISIEAELNRAGFQAESEDGYYLVKETFPIGDKKHLTVCASVSENGQTQILLWQSVR